MLAAIQKPVSYTDLNDGVVCGLGAPRRDEYSQHLTKPNECDEIRLSWAEMEARTPPLATRQPHRSVYALPQDHTLPYITHAAPATEGGGGRENQSHAAKSAALPHAAEREERREEGVQANQSRLAWGAYE